MGGWWPIVLPIPGLFRDFGEANVRLRVSTSSLFAVSFRHACSSLATAVEGSEAEKRGGAETKSRHHRVGADRVFVVRSFDSCREVWLP